MKDRITENQLQLITKDKKLSEMIEGITQIRSIVKEKMKANNIEFESIKL